MHGMNLGDMFASMGPIPKGVVFVLLLMSVYSIAIGVERIIVYSKAKKQSNILLRLIGKLWQEGKIEESIKVSSDKKFKNSHLAKVLVAGLNELQFQEDEKAPYAEKVESAKRAIERATIKGLVEFRRGLSGLEQCLVLSPRSRAWLPPAPPVSARWRLESPRLSLPPVLVSWWRLLRLCSSTSS